MRSNEFFHTKSCTKHSINLQENSRHSIGLTLRRAGHFERWPNFVCSFWKFLFFQNIIMILSFFSCLIRLKKFNDFFQNQITPRKLIKKLFGKHFQNYFLAKILCDSKSKSILYHKIEMSWQPPVNFMNTCSQNWILPALSIQSTKLITLNQTNFIWRLISLHNYINIK